VTIPELERELARAQRASEKASAARAALPPGSSRARVTTANARWMRAAEHRDRILAQLEAARAGSRAEHINSEVTP
jgi:hypothetical protein